MVAVSERLAAGPQSNVLLNGRVMIDVQESQRPPVEDHKRKIDPRILPHHNETLNGYNREALISGLEPPSKEHPGYGVIFNDFLEDEEPLLQIIDGDKKIDVKLLRIHREEVSWYAPSINLGAQNWGHKSDQVVKLKMPGSEESIDQKVKVLKSYGTDIAYLFKINENRFGIGIPLPNQEGEPSAAFRLAALLNALQEALHNPDVNKNNTPDEPQFKYLPPNTDY